MSPELTKLVESVRGHVMTPKERFEQRVSFVYGQQDWDSPIQHSKDEIRSQMIGMGYGYPGMPDGIA